MHIEPSGRGKRLALAGAILQLGPVVGAIATSIGIFHAFGVLAQAGESDPRALAGKVGEVLIFLILGLGVGLIGLVLIGVAVTLFRYRSPWVFWLLVVDGIIYLFGFPIGSIVGVFILIYCLTHRAEFLKPGIPAA